MTNQEILEKARNKAVKNGWKGSPFIDNLNDYQKLLESKLQTDIVYGENWWELVVLLLPPHDFAKALWGEGPSYECEDPRDIFKVHEFVYFKNNAGSNKW